MKKLATLISVPLSFGLGVGFSEGSASTDLGAGFIILGAVIGASLLGSYFSSLTRDGL